MEEDIYTVANAEALDELAKRIRETKDFVYTMASLDTVYLDSSEAQAVKKEIALLLNNLHARSLYNGERKFRIHYTEIGHGKMIKGKLYDGRKKIIVRALSAKEAVTALRQMYSGGAITSIDGVEPVIE